MVRTTVHPRSAVQSSAELYRRPTKGYADNPKESIESTTRSGRRERRMISRHGCPTCNPSRRAARGDISTAPYVQSNIKDECLAARPGALHTAVVMHVGDLDVCRHSSLEFVKVYQACRHCPSACMNTFRLVADGRPGWQGDEERQDIRIAVR